MPIGVLLVGPLIPLLKDGAIKMPSGGVHVHKTKLLYDQIPNPKGVTALEE